MLGALALKRRWGEERQRDAGKPADKPNLMLGINAQICWDKFCNFFEVEPRFVMMEGDRFTLAASRRPSPSATRTRSAWSRSSGRRSTAAYEAVAGIAAALDELQERTGLDIPMHVDGASGAMVAPFLDPD